MENQPQDPQPNQPQQTNPPQSPQNAEDEKSQPSPEPAKNKLYYGPYLVTEVIDDGDEQILTIEIYDTNTEKTRKKRIARILESRVLTQEPTDFNTLVFNRVEPMALEILSVLLKWGAEIEEIQHVFKRVGMSIDNSADMIDLMIWGSPREERNMIEFDRYMKAHADQLPNDNSAT